ncbi:DUF4192 domain-containing protein [Herbiconiux daphne]|uniref:DUF4192 domain-containing protein n=1 Tax=Herbiconiux daphne TaxID=2970914 RepID=A0ABT2H119_9MICO|nr:DUF4192 domain-containing protein [Herbiconiux daphne]MCS5733615.1 DUF4192 domain-containing protein [Herbiconiux daphne]
MSTITTSPPTTHRLAEIVREVDSVLGLRPSNSLVLVIRRRRRPPAVVRVDLPPPGGAAGDDYAHAITGVVARVTAATAAEIVLYGGPDDGPDDGPPSSAALRPVLERVRSRLSAAGFEVPRAFFVIRGRWADAAERPEAWHPLPAAVVPPAGDVTRGGDPHHGPFVPIVPLSERRRSRAMASVAVLDRPGRADPDADVVDVLLRWHDALRADPAAGPPSDARTVSLAWSLRHKLVRDCVLMMCAWGLEAGVVALHESVQHAAHPDAPEHLPEDRLLSTFLGEGTRAPAPADLARAVGLLRHIVSCVPDSIAAPPLTMLGWLEWARGRGSVAARYFEEGLRADPDYELAGLFLQVIDHALVPEWLGEAPGSPLTIHR